MKGIFFDDDGEKRKKPNLNGHNAFFSKFNLAIMGPPGTGKTIFVSKYHAMLKAFGIINSENHL